jgi:signal transduction histidine kinase
MCLVLVIWPGSLDALGEDTARISNVFSPEWHLAWFWGGTGLVAGLIAFLVGWLVIRARKLAEANRALATAHKDLENRIQSHKAELAEAKKLVQRERSDRRLAEKEQLELERLRAFSELSVGVSHNLNNLLVGIMGPVELLQATDDPGKRRTYLAMILRSSARMAEVVEQLHLSSAINDLGEIGKTDVDQAVLSAIDMTRPRWKDEAESKGITISVRNDLSGTPAVRANDQELRVVVTAVMLNAIDAMPKGGRILIESKCENSVVVITITDTGIGMDEELRARVFDPFFSTKKTVGGGGLGLSMVRGTLHRWGARVTIESKPEWGTTFSLALPAWKGDTSNQPNEEESPRRVPRKRVIVVDDQEVILRTLEKALGSHHDVDVALSGEEGLALFEEKKHDLALIDLSMPDMPGNQVAEAMKRKNPDVMTVMITGWQLDVTDDRLEFFDGLLTKPFKTLDALREAVANMALVHEDLKNESDERASPA